MKHRARKHFGQNFLHDRGIIERIIQSIRPQAGDHLLEIGPGQGALTEYLVTANAKLDCVELDRDLAKFLDNLYGSRPGFTLYQEDILKFDLGKLEADKHSLRVIGNLPYNISTPVLFYLLKNCALIRDMTFMLQLEVVQRLAAQVGEKNYGRLGLMLQYFCTVEHLFDVSASSFSPQPKVSSAVVRLTPHVKLPLPARSVENLQIVIRTAFSQRRKTLKNSLKSIISEQALRELPLDISLRPENLSLADYVLISDVLISDTLPIKPPAL
ncbi:MAG: 16S rRNA (adenine(1518)-N(6)/adenine(1519)-N(6))-dimethyltransferase RsmA [Pseudomonadales bacterium]|nr:16S rRNA (adenine(1518)-N(6)/adenine(1519)-N(6))-dimethyltransferase RsmA [Pseudomonadales bacterium]